MVLRAHFFPECRRISRLLRTMSHVNSLLPRRNELWTLSVEQSYYFRRLTVTLHRSVGSSQEPTSITIYCSRSSVLHSRRRQSSRDDVADEIHSSIMAIATSISDILSYVARSSRSREPLSLRPAKGISTQLLQRLLLPQLS